MEKNEKNVNEVVKEAINGAEVVKVNYHGYEVLFSNEIAKRIPELTDEDIEKLHSVNYCAVSSVYNKKTRNWRYLMTVHFLANYIVENIPLTLKKMTLICASQNIKFDPKIELPLKRIDCKARFVHGISGADSKTPNEPYTSCHIFPLGESSTLRRNTIMENIYVDDVILAELQIYKMLDKIVFKRVSSKEEEPIQSFEDISY